MKKKEEEKKNISKNSRTRVHGIGFRSGSLKLEGATLRLELVALRLDSCDFPSRRNSRQDLGRCPERGAFFRKRAMSLARRGSSVLIGWWSGGQTRPFEPPKALGGGH